MLTFDMMEALPSFGLQTNAWQRLHDVLIMSRQIMDCLAKSNIRYIRYEDHLSAVYQL